ncbi:hypothetical protein BGZ80_007058 [Entomortierella chlamydospora]|uniref:Arrestin C-terminal-like domain-containing protein n=1 Tax=Entomortierella chlamydospora TaxID=101097 RepID=A0A9P6MYE6_9FUNG|nr:hypothetical protein BGZ80_007058 [Entomortierella chlamydospora]
MSEESNHTDAAEHAFCERTPSYSDIHNHVNDSMTDTGLFGLRPQSRDLEPPYSPFQRGTQDIDPRHQQSLNILSTYCSATGLKAMLELESDTIEIYDRSNDSFQYTLKGTVDLDWIGDSELLLRDARVDFMGYADTAVLRYEAGGSTETPVHHTHDFVPTPMVLNPSPVPRDNSVTPADQITKRHHSLPIDLTLPGHLPDSADLEIGKIRYELQVSLELVFAQGTSASTTEQFILRRPVLIHRIVYPSAHLQPRVAMGLDSGGVEIQVKVPRLLHCENTLLAVELYVKPRTRNVRLRKAKIVFEQIETDRYQRSSPIVAVPKAVVPLATPTHSSATSPPLSHAQLPMSQFAGPPPTPRLLTRAIAQPLEVEFEEPTQELQTQTLSLQLVLSPELCVDVQSSWIQISHTLRVEVEYTTDEESYVIAPPTSAPPNGLQELESSEVQLQTLLDQVTAVEPISTIEQAPITHDRELEATLWEQEGDAMETYTNDQEYVGDGVNYDESILSLDEKKALDEKDTGPSPAHSRHSESNAIQTDNTTAAAAATDDTPVLLSTQTKKFSDLSTSSSGSAPTSYPFSLATEEIPVRVVRVVSTALVDASTLAQAAGETESGLPTYESVIEATGLPAYAEEKLEDDHEEAEASGTATGVLGGAARRLEGEDAELERR